MELEAEVKMYEDIFKRSEFNIVYSEQECFNNVQKEFNLLFGEFKAFTIKKFGVMISGVFSLIILIFMLNIIHPGFFLHPIESVFNADFFELIFAYFFSVVSFITVYSTICSSNPTFKIKMNKNIFENVKLHYKSNKNDRIISLMEGFIIGLVFFILGKLL